MTPVADHESDADHHHAEVASDVSDAKAAVVATTRSLDRISEMLARHFRLGVGAVATAVLIGGSMLYVVVEMKNTQDAFNAQASATQIQAVANEVAVLRHRVHSTEGNLRLCTIALGASRPAAEAERICAPVVGPDFEETKARLAAGERRLQELREAL